ncbi:hypothetical protein C0992_007008, partial [Termitomyces sp. T32_za158]
DSTLGQISYRISTWRNGFLSAADAAVKALFTDPDNYDHFQMPEACKEAVKWWLDFQGPEDEETAPYQFKKCIENSGERRKSVSTFNYDASLVQDWP